MILLLVLWASIGGGLETKRTARVDLIELNHFIDEDGRHVFRQVIFYDWSPRDKAFHVRGWRLVKKPLDMPRQYWNPARYECMWFDDAVVKKVYAPSFRETWSQKDPERVNRKILPEDQRIPLFPKRQKPDESDEPDCSCIDRATTGEC